MSLPFPAEIFGTGSNAFYRAEPAKDDEHSICILYSVRDTVDEHLQKVIIAGYWYPETDMFKYEMLDSGYYNMRWMQADEFGILALLSIHGPQRYTLSDLQEIFDGS